MDLSVIIPFANELPQVAFTVQNAIEELDGFCKYEIVLVDNMSNTRMVVRGSNAPWTPLAKMTPEDLEAAKTEREYPAFSRNYFWDPEKGTMKTMFFRKGVIKYFRYDAKQGHWNAKNHGLKNSTGKYVFFLDAHCVMKRDSLRKMLTFLQRNEGKEYDHPMTPGKKWRVGAVHAYINYMLDSRCLEYKVQRKTFGYQFCTHQMEEYWDMGIEDVEARLQSRALRFPTKPYQVCVMSTCGMMCPRSVLDDLGAWNPEFGIYGGGESYINWKQSTCGYGHWIHPDAWCWHFADKRGYSWNHSDFIRNSFIAAYVVGGEAFLGDQVEQRCRKESPERILALAEDVRTTCKADRDLVASRQIVSFEDYISWWEAHPGVWK